MWSNTFGATLAVALTAAVLPELLPSWPEVGVQAEALLDLVMVTLAACRCVVTCCVMLCCAVLHRHILVWAILAPRFVFEAFFQLQLAITLGVLHIMLPLRTRVIHGWAGPIREPRGFVNRRRARRMLTASCPEPAAVRTPDDPGYTLGSAQIRSG